MKLNTAIDHERRMASHKNVLHQINVSKKFEQDYKEFIVSANERIKEYQTKLKQVKDKLISMENERCQNIHQAVGGFVVYEKNAEMNNKYDIKNFAKLIEQFKLEEELTAIVNEVELSIPKNRLPLKSSQFDPIYTDENVAAYQFNQY